MGKEDNFYYIWNFKYRVSLAPLCNRLGFPVSKSDRTLTDERDKELSKFSWATVFPLLWHFFFFFLSRTRDKIPQNGIRVLDAGTEGNFSVNKSIDNDGTVSLSSYRESVIERIDECGACVDFDEVNALVPGDSVPAINFSVTIEGSNLRSIYSDRETPS